MANIANFSFNSTSVRSFTDANQEPYFLANDVCHILGYKNPRTAITNHCREWGVLKQDTPTESGIQSMVYLSEGNVYRLIAKSRKPEAVAFEKNLFEVILPTIRKTGTYTITATPEQKQHVKSLVNKRVFETGAQYQAAWNAVFDACGFNKLENLTPAAYDRAMQYFGVVPQPVARMPLLSVGQLVIERNRLADMMRDVKVLAACIESNMSKLYTRMDYMSMIPEDLTDANWKRHAITC